MIQITVEGRRASVSNKEILTSGSVGIECQWTFSEDWAGLTKTAVFRFGEDGDGKEIVLTSTNRCVVPWEVLTEEGEPVFAGVYGINDETGTIVVPTVWASIGVVKPGVEVGTPAIPAPTPSEIDQVKTIANDALNTAQQAMSYAEGEVDSARQYAESAELSMQGAASYYRMANDKAYQADRAAGNANGFALTAGNYAQTASQSASEASQSATNAASSASTATAKASEANTSATTASQAAQSASGSATAAENSYISARDEASQAATSATTARGMALTAGNYMQAAAQSAAQAAGSATNASTAQTAAETAQGAAETAQGKAEDAQAAAEDAQAAAEASAQSVSASAAQIAQNASDISDLSRQISDVEENQIPELKSALNNNGIGNSFNGELYNGYWNAEGVLAAYEGDVCNASMIPCPENASVRVVASTTAVNPAYFIYYFDQNNSRFSRISGFGTEYSGIAPTGTVNMGFCFEQSGLTKDRFASVGVYINNALTQMEQSISELDANLDDCLSALDSKVDLTGENQVTPQNIAGMQFTKTTEEVEGENIFTSDMLFEEGYYVAVDPQTGNVTHGASSWYNAYCIPVEQNTKYRFTTSRFVVLATGNTLGSPAIGTMQEYSSEIETGEATYLFLSIDNDVISSISDIYVKPVTVDVVYSDFVLPDWLQPDVDLSGIESRLESVESGKVDKDGTGQIKPQNIEGVTVSGGNILNDAERLYSTQTSAPTTDGYVTIDNNTAIIQSTGDFCSFLIPVKPNTHYTANNSIRFAVLLKNLSSEGTSPVRYSTVVGSALANITSFDTGEADHIIVSWNYSTYPINTFVISEGYTPTTNVEITLPDWWTGGAEIVKPKYISTTGSLSDGTFLALMGYKQNLRKGERYAFSGNIGTISSLHFGFTFANSFSASTTIYNEFTIDGTYITYKNDSTSSSYINRYEHGLTFLNNLQFIFEYLPEGNAKITLISNGIMFTQTLPFVKQTISQVVVLSVGSTLTNCKLTWTPIDIDKSIWMFGDSYFAYSSERWIYYLQQYGYAQNALIDGWPGEGSVNAKNSLLTLIQFGKPKYIVWCMGMNDGSDTDASTPSTDWVTNRDHMLSICEENGITPIFATIPNVPSVLHTGKNAWIKASGYRYIDFAAAVGAESAASKWFSGMLSSDNIHPSESGAKALFARALVDFPEIMLNE